MLCLRRDKGPCSHRFLKISRSITFRNINSQSCLASCKYSEINVIIKIHDTVEKIGRSLVQHGRYNDRIYLMKLHGGETDKVFEYIGALLQKHSYSKIFAKIPSEAQKFFREKNFVKEAEIPRFYNGHSKGLFLCNYLSPGRKYQKEQTKTKINNVLTMARKKALSLHNLTLPAGFSLERLDDSHGKKLAALYKKVFPTYPFPIYDSEYLLQSMRETSVYFGVFFENKLVAASSAEMDVEAENVEMTDFATDPDFNKNGLSLVLLDTMEHEMKKLNIKTFYTIARSLSYGMNITFSKRGYTYSGTLINNTNISGKIESMNVWYKHSC